MANTRISANPGSDILKMPAFSEQIVKPATNSKQHHVNIAGRGSIGSNFTQSREMRPMSQFQGRHSHDQGSSVRRSLFRKTEVHMRRVRQRPGHPGAAVIVHAHAEARNAEADESDRRQLSDHGPDDVGRMETLC